MRYRFSGRINKKGGYGRHRCQSLYIDTILNGRRKVSYCFMGIEPMDRKGKASKEKVIKSTRWGCGWFHNKH